MSTFLPEGVSQTQGQTALTPANPNVTQEDVALMQRVLKAAAANPNLIPDEFMAYAVDYIQTANLIIPIGQVFGFTNFTAQASDFIAGSESTTSNAYTDLATVGPTLSGLGPGNYVIFQRAVADVNAAGNAGYMSISINGVAAIDNDAAWVQVPNFVSITSFSLQRLTGDSNTIVAKYRAAAGTAFFQNRLLVALRYSNL